MSYLPLNKKVTCDFVFSFTIYKSWKSYFRNFQNVSYVQMFGKDSGFVFADIYSKKFQKKMAVNIPGQFVGSRSDEDCLK